ncbi:MAG: hypothetical protein OJF49_002063 [Ktedonobacterales bacterium]|jgi:MFS family permease|nr:MAG: hypothetical protein OJF49_002063 [Ktedonobacterales bacterium]
MNGKNLRVLREERAFARLLSASFISRTGDWFNTVAVLSLLLTLTGSGLAVGVALALQVFPRLVFSPVAGILADRLPRKAILIVTDLCSMGLALSLLLVTTPGRVWIVYVGTIGLVVCSNLRAPARTAIVPDLVRPENLLAANGLEGVMSGSVMMLGAVLGGIASGVFGPQVAFVLNALSFLVSALLIVSIRIPAGERRTRRGKAALGSIWPLLRNTPLLRIILLLAMLWPLGGGMLNVLLSVYAFQVFHAGDAGVGVLYGAIGVGLLLGGMLTTRFARWMRGAIAGAYVLEGVCNVLMSRSPSLGIAAVLLVVGTLASGVGNACISFLLMPLTPSRQLGRVSALMSTVSSCTFGGSLLLSGVLLARVAPRELGLLGGMLITVAGLVGALALWRTPLPVETAHEEETAERAVVAKG